MIIAGWVLLGSKMKSGFHFCKCRIEENSRKLRAINNSPALAKIAGFSLAFFLRMAKLQFDLLRAEAQFISLDQHHWSLHCGALE
jgi:hypothetical protein